MTYTEIENAINEGLENDRKEYRVRFDKVMKDGRTHDVFRLKNESRIEPIYYIRNDLTEGFIYGDLVKELDVAYNKMPEIPELTKEYILKNVHKGLCPMNRVDEFESLNVECYTMYDLLVYFYIDLDLSNDLGQASIKITKGLMKTYDIEFYELDEASNMQEASIKDISEVLRSMLNVEMPEQELKMLVITTKTNCKGAGEIMSINTRKKVYKELGNTPYYIIPSSVHEVLAIPTSAGEIKEIKKMIREVNSTLEEEDILSNNLYICTQNLHFDVAI